MFEPEQLRAQKYDLYNQNIFGHIHKSDFILLFNQFLSNLGIGLLQQGNEQEGIFALELSIKINTESNPTTRHWPLF